MPRDGTETYILPFPDVEEDTTIESAVYNGFTNDVAADLNTPRPVKFGGTGATSPASARTALGVEVASAVVTNYDSHVFEGGSFYSSVGATAAPTANAFAGICYKTNASNLVIEARDSTTGILYIKRRVAGVWGAWGLENDLSGINADVAAALLLKVNKAGDTMSGQLSLLLDPEDPLHAVRRSYVDSISAALEDYVDSAAATLAGMLKKNYVVNGAMMISQENGATAMTTSGSYAVDQFRVSFATSGTLSHQQASVVSLGGSPNRLRVTCLSADATVGASDFVAIVQPIEGYRVADLQFGTAAAKTVTIQFSVRAPAGTYGVTLVNSANNRSYAAEYVISAPEADTDVVKSVTIPGDTSGTWLKDNGVGMYIEWGLMAGNGAGFGISPGAWAGTGGIGTVNQTNFMVLGNVFILSDVGLYEGNTAAAFVPPDYARELALCQRYWVKTFNSNVNPAQNAGLNGTFTVSTNATSTFAGSCPLPVEMRDVPVIVTFNPSAANANWRDTTNTADRTASATAGTRMVYLQGAAGVVNGVNRIHFTANARL